METLSALAELNLPKKLFYMLANYHLPVEEEPHKLLKNCITSGYLELIPFLKRKGLITYQYAIDYSAQANYTLLVKWFHEHGRDEDQMATTAAMDYAARSGNIEILEFLYHNRSEGCSTNASTLAVLCNKLETAIWLDERGLFITNPKMMSICAIHNYVEMTKWLLTKSVTPSQKDLDLAKRIGNEHFLSIVFEQ